MLNNIGLPGLLLIIVVTLVLFGRGKISALMGELGSGLTAFKKGLREAEAEAVPAAELPDAAVAAREAASTKQI